MANEISVNLALSVRNGLHEESFTLGSGRFDQTEQGSAGGVIEVGTAAQTITLGDVTTAGWSAFRNLSTATSGTAYIALGAYDGTNVEEFMALGRGDGAVLPLSGSVVIGAKAYGNAVPLRYIVFSK